MFYFTLVQVLLCLLIMGYFMDRRTRRRYVRRFRDAERFRPAVVLAFGTLAVLNMSVLLAPTDVLQATAGALTSLAGAAVIVMLLEHRVQNEAVGRPRRILVVGAHPDDLELACGGTIAKLVDSGHEVRGLIMSHGARGGDERRRIIEAQEGGRYLGMSRIDIQDFPDCAFTATSRELIEAVEGPVQEFQPDVILTHSANDQHQDHHAVHHAVLRAARFHSSILCFESPSVTRAFNPSFFVDIVEYVHVKVEAVQVHQDQSAKPYMRAERIRGMSAFRGQQAKIRHAEAFEPVRIVGSAFGDF